MATIVDDKDTVQKYYQETGNWVSGTWPGGQGGTYRAAPKGTGECKAKWTVANITPGAYEVFAAWVKHSNRGTTVPYTISDGSTPLQTVLVNQKVSPGANGWFSLGKYNFTTTTLSVEVTNATDGYAVADAISFTPTTIPTPTYDDPTVIKDKYGLYVNGGYQTNSLGGNEKWLMGSDGAWFYLLPTGELWRWSGAGLTGTLVAKLSPAVYTDPTPLHAPISNPDPTPDPNPDNPVPTRPATIEPTVPLAYDGPPVFLWSQSQQDVFNRMVAENHPWWNYIKSCVPQEDNSWGWAGQWAALAYRMTGDATYVQNAWTNLLSKRFVPENNWGVGAASNWSREYLIEFAIMYDWMRPALTMDQRSTFLTYLNLFADTILGNWPVPNVGESGYGIRASDTDETLGDYLGCMLIYSLPDNPRKDEYNTRWVSTANGPKLMGGLDVSSSFDLTNRTNQSTVRDQFEWLVNLAKGGCWMESSEYNIGTLRLAIMGCEALRTATGADHFPALTKVLKGAAIHHLCQMTPDQHQTMQWGDVEHPRYMGSRLYQYLTTMAMFAGMFQNDPDVGPHLVGAMNVLTEAGKLNLDARAFYQFNPYVTPTAPEAWPKSSICQGQGILLNNTASSQFSAHFPPAGQVDHAVRFNGNFQIYRNGEWAITHPLGYGAATEQGEGTNSMLVGGLGWAGQNMGMLSGQVGDAFAYAAGVADGWHYAPGTWAAPPTFTYERTRSQFFLSGDATTPDVLVVHDRVSADDPKQQGYDLDQSWYPTEANRIKSVEANKVWICHTPVSPTVDETAGTIAWQTTNGMPINVKLHLPTAVKMVIADEKQVFANGISAGEVGDSELHWQVRVHPATAQKWDTFLSAFSIGGNVATTLFTDPGKAEAVLIQRGTEETLVVFGSDPVSRDLKDFHLTLPAGPDRKVFLCRPTVGVEQLTLPAGTTVLERTS